MTHKRQWLRAASGLWKPRLARFSQRCKAWRPGSRFLENQLSRDPNPGFRLSRGPLLVGGRPDEGAGLLRIQRLPCQIFKCHAISERLFLFLYVKAAVKMLDRHDVTHRDVMDLRELHERECGSGQ